MPGRTPIFVDSAHVLALTNERDQWHATALRWSEKIAAVALYSSRPDKDWGVTDCASFVTMKDRAITEALTVDRHFEQAGFCALLLER